MGAKPIFAGGAVLLCLAACGRIGAGEESNAGANDAEAASQGGATAAIGGGGAPVAPGGNAAQAAGMPGGGAACPQVVRASDTGAATPDGVRNRISVDATGAITWNGNPVDAVTLRQYLDITAAMNPRPTLVTSAAAEANPAAVQSVLDAIQQALGCRPGSL